LLRAILKLLAALQLPGAAAALLRLALRVRPKDAQALHELHALALARGDRPEATRVGERLLELNPDDSGIRWNLALLALQAGDADAALRHFARHDELRSKGALATRVCVDSLLDPERAAAGEPYVARLRNVLVETALWSVIDGDKVYVREVHDRTLANGPYVAGRMFPDGRRFVVSLPAPAISIDTPCVLLGGDENYSHWLTRNLIKLCLVEGQPEYADLPLLINEDLSGYQREYLELLGIPEDRLIKVPRGSVVACRDLVVPTQLRNHPQMRRGIDWLRTRLAPHMDPRPARNRIFVSRRENPVRVLLNEPELERALRPLGFETVVPGKMTVREQVRAFSGADVIVAVHGAGFTNLLYAPADVKVVELASGTIAKMDDFRQIARAIGQRLVPVISDDYDLTRPETLDANWDYRVSVTDVLDALEKVAPDVLGDGKRPDSDRQ
jgi:capsular polysaccharide biosynthesis protein